MHDKGHPRYDDSAHIDSAAIDHTRKPGEDYTVQYLAPLNGKDVVRPSPKKP